MQADAPNPAVASQRPAFRIFHERLMAVYCKGSVCDDYFHRIETTR